LEENQLFAIFFIHFLVFGHAQKDGADFIFCSVFTGGEHRPGGLFFCFLRYFSSVRRSFSGRKTMRLSLPICATGIRVSELRFITVEAVRAGRAEISNKGKRRIVCQGVQITLFFFRGLEWYLPSCKSN